MYQLYRCWSYSGKNHPAINCVFCFLFSSWPERSGTAERSALHHGGPDTEDVQGGQPGNGHDSQFNTDTWRGRQENQGTTVAFISALKGLLINVQVYTCFHLSTPFCLCWYIFGMENLIRVWNFLACKTVHFCIPLPPLPLFHFDPQISQIKVAVPCDSPPSEDWHTGFMKERHCSEC